MEIMKKITQFVETYDSAFIVGNIPPTELIYYNETATTSYGITGKFDVNKFDTIFYKKDYGIKEKIENGYLDNGYLFIDNFEFPHFFRKSEKKEIPEDKFACLRREVVGI